MFASPTIRSCARFIEEALKARYAIALTQHNPDSGQEDELIL
jgi:hypothetical protein